MFKHNAFKAIAILIPLVIIVFLELILRMFHYGYSTRVMIEDSNGIIHVNTQVSKTFFISNQDARLGISHTFKKEKSPETVRIFVLGESSALGYPYTQRGSFPRMLSYRLEKTFTDKNIEMINLSLTAVNSYTLLTFAREIIEMDPDAVLIYTGHNEYYGALGAGSAHFIAGNRNLVKLIIALKKFRVIQLVFQASDGLMKRLKHDNNTPNQGFMHRMAAKQEIILGSKEYYQGIKQFESNMQELLDEFNQHQIPVYLSNIVSNEKGQKPFVSKLQNESDSTAFFSRLRSGMEAFNNRDFSKAYNSFFEAYQIDSTYAMNLFLMGECKYQFGEFPGANRYYAMAREHDALRFRAPEAINSIISGLCENFSNALFVDSRAVFEKYSDNGVLDNKLFMDHLHPNLTGYFLIADAFYNSILETQIIDSPFIPAAFDKTWNELPVTEIDSIYGSWMCIVMKEQWPFFEKAGYEPDTVKSYPEKITMNIFQNRINMDMALDSLYRYYLNSGNLREALKVVKSVELDHPNQWKLASEAGRLAGELGDSGESIFYYKKSFALFNQIETARKVVFGLIQLDQPEETLRYLDYLRQNDPGDKMSVELMAKVSEVIRLKNQFATEPENIQLINRLTAYYLYTGNLQEAKKFIDRAMIIEPGNRNSKEYLKIYSAANDPN